MLLLFRVTVPDSVPHRDWLPTELVVQTDRGYNDTVLLIPFACLLTAPGTHEFPFNFEWLKCNVVGINTEVSLTAQQVHEVERAVSGELI